MALSKDIDTTTGATAAYWRITRGNYDFVGGRMVFEMSGYASEAARRAGKAPMAVVHYDMWPSPGKAIHDMTLADMYGFAKSALPGICSDLEEAQARFDGATDA